MMNGNRTKKQDWVIPPDLLMRSLLRNYRTSNNRLLNNNKMKSLPEGCKRKKIARLKNSLNSLTSPTEGKLQEHQQHLRPHLLQEEENSQAQEQPQQPHQPHR